MLKDILRRYYEPKVPAFLLVGSLGALLLTSACSKAPNGREVRHCSQIINALKTHRPPANEVRTLNEVAVRQDFRSLPDVRTVETKPTSQVLVAINVAQNRLVANSGVYEEYCTAYTKE